MWMETEVYSALQGLECLQKIMKDGLVTRPEWMDARRGCGNLP